ncbi:carbohydrate ABC transporter permease [Frondihabitans sp. 762G35]|uniref:carbohydrate ABC transporter permease n=1 Tax=Frondihabitans sp. 762G35 TaxID=1446794 RepID=UPI000E706E69|nr:carbohydrate ABC transporter permease [Frondihabitans sp. 762G35]
MSTLSDARTTPATRPEPAKSRRIKGHKTRNFIGAFGGYVWLAVIILPIYYIVITSLRPQDGFYSSNQLVPPSAPTLSQYALVLQSDFFLYLANSAIVTVVSVAVTVAVSLGAAYAVVRSQTRFTKLGFSIFLVGLAVPLQATIIPLFYMMSKVGLYDSLMALILPSIGFAIPLTVLVLSNFLRDLPNELFESMRVDGASNWRILISLVTPLSRPALITVIIYDALTVWNGFLFPLVLTQSPDKRTLPLSLWTFQGQFSVNVPATLAAVVLSTLPIFALYLVGRRQLVAGITAGFGK